MSRVVVLDTETTGLPDSWPFRVVEIAVVDLATGETILDTRVNPRVPGEDACSIPAAASRVHGITDADVADAPDWGVVRIELAKIFKESRVVWTYNADFDSDVIRTHDRDYCRAVGCAPLSPLRFSCAMMWDADPWRLDSRARWRKLYLAARDAGHEWTGSAHGALTDALACRSVVRRLKERWARGVPCVICAQKGRPEWSEDASYCRECVAALEPMVQALLTWSGALGGGRHAAEWADGCLSSTSRARRAARREAMDAALTELGVTVSDEYYTAALRIARNQLW
jgi:DNA polymerase III epsilon subunit-like protein